MNSNPRTISHRTRNSPRLAPRLVLLALVVAAIPGCAPLPADDPYAPSDSGYGRSDEGSFGFGGGGAAYSPSYVTTPPRSATSNNSHTSNATATPKSSGATAAAPKSGAGGGTGVLGAADTVAPSSSVSTGSAALAPTPKSAPTRTPQLFIPTVSAFEPDSGAIQPAAGVAKPSAARQIAMLTPKRKPLPSEVIVLDPGHGGSDTGCLGHGMREKDITLTVTLKLAEMLRQAGFTVQLTRSKDVAVEVPARVEYASKYRPLLFLSVHANAFMKSESRGVETIYWSQGRHVADSRKLATLIQADVSAAVPTVDRGERPDVRKLYVLKNAEYPAALVEIGFLTNPSDASYLGSPDHRVSIAKALYNGVVRYFNQRK